MDLSLFLDWYQSRGIKLHSSIEVRDSLLGGLGIFANNVLDEDLVVLRVPKTSVFDLKTLFGLAEELKAGDDSKTVSAILNAALHAGGHSSETIIIRSFLWGLAMLMGQKNLVENGVYGQIEAYLHVLLSTPTLDINEEIETSDFLILDLVTEKNLVKKDYLNLVSEYPGTKSMLSFEHAFQLHQAIKSRVLEIPQAENGLNEYEYSTNITLVPVLDFANHSIKNNAVFDVDPVSNEVILRVVRKVEESEEITISYDPVNSVNKFIKTYGFIPAGPYTMDLEIPNINLILNEINDTTNEDYVKIAKWLQVPPILTVCTDTAGNLGLDAKSLRLPLLLIPDLTYYRHWTSEVSDIAEEFEVSTEIEVEQIIAELQRQESHEIVVVGADTAFGVTWHDNYVCISRILEQTGVSENHNQISVLALRTAATLRRTASRPRIPRSALADSEVLDQYYGLKNDVLDKLMKMDETQLLKDIQNSFQNLLQ